MARQLKFELITDSRFEDINIIDDMIKELESKFNELKDFGVEFEHYPKREYTWKQDSEKQNRISCYVKKNSRKITWNDIYSLVGSVRPCYYEFIKA